jgi:hypothetical protein
VRRGAATADINRRTQMLTL